MRRAVIETIEARGPDGSPLPLNTPSDELAPTPPNRRRVALEQFIASSEDCSRQDGFAQGYAQAIEDMRTMTPAQMAEMLELLDAWENGDPPTVKDLTPDDGPLRAALTPEQIEVIERYATRSGLSFYMAACDLIRPGGPFGEFGFTANVEQWSAMQTRTWGDVVRPDAEIETATLQGRRRMNFPPRNVLQQQQQQQQQKEQP